MLFWHHASASHMAGQRTLIQVQSFHLGHAFAAIMADGSVVCWGDRRIGGDCQRVQEQLRHVTQLQSSSGAFAAIQSDGTVTAWGNSACGGDSSQIQDQLRYLAPRVAGKFCHWNSETMTNYDKLCVTSFCRHLKLDQDTFAKSNLQNEHLLRSEAMAQLFVGACQSMVVRAAASKLNWSMSEKSSPPSMHLPRFWKMAVSWPGGMLFTGASWWNLVLTWRRDGDDRWRCEVSTVSMIHLVFISTELMMHEF